MSVPAGAALGSTTDAKALVIGDAGVLHTAAQSLRAQAAQVEIAGEGLKAVKTGVWSGSTYDAFTASYSTAAPRWFALHDVVTSCARAVTAHATALVHAQGQAQKAIETYAAGELATRTAKAAHDAKVAKLQSSSPMAVPFLSPPFNDPGQKQRDEAQAILTEARAALDEAGLSAAQTMNRQGGVEWHESSVSGGWWQGDASGEGLRGSYGTDEAGRRSLGVDWRKPGEGEGEHKIQVWDAAAGAYVWRTTKSVEGNYRGVDYDGSGSLAGPGVGVHSSASLGNGKVSGAVGAEATLASASADAQANYGAAALHAGAEAKVGAFVDAEASVGKDGAHVGGEAMLGAKATATSGVDVGGVGAEGTVEGWAGAGLGGDVDAGFRDGKIELGGYFGAGLGLGGKLGGHITVDPLKVVDTAGDIADGVIGFFGG